MILVQWALEEKSYSLSSRPGWDVHLLLVSLPVKWSVNISFKKNLEQDKKLYECKTSRTKDHMHSLWSQKHSPPAMSGESWGLESSPTPLWLPDVITEPLLLLGTMLAEHNTMQRSAETVLPLALASPALPLTEGSEPHGSAVLRKPTPQAVFAFFFFFFSCVHLF